LGTRSPLRDEGHRAGDPGRDVQLRQQADQQVRAGDTGADDAQAQAPQRPPGADAGLPERGGKVLPRGEMPGVKVLVTDMTANLRLCWHNKILDSPSSCHEDCLHYYLFSMYTGIDIVFFFPSTVKCISTSSFQLP